MQYEADPSKVIYPIVRVIFPEFDEGELLLAQERIGDLLKSLYVMYLEDLADEAGRPPLDKIGQRDSL